DGAHVASVDTATVGVADVRLGMWLPNPLRHHRLRQLLHGRRSLRRGPPGPLECSPLQLALPLDEFLRASQERRLDPEIAQRTNKPGEARLRLHRASLTRSWSRQP